MGGVQLTLQTLFAVCVQHLKGYNKDISQK